MDELDPADVPPPDAPPTVEPPPLPSTLCVFVGRVTCCEVGLALSRLLFDADPPPAWPLCDTAAAPGDALLAAVLLLAGGEDTLGSFFTAALDWLVALVGVADFETLCEGLEVVVGLEGTNGAAEGDKDVLLPVLPTLLLLFERFRPSTVRPLGFAVLAVVATAEGVDVFGVAAFALEDLLIKNHVYEKTYVYQGVDHLQLRVSTSDTMPRVLCIPAGVARLVLIKLWLMSLPSDALRRK